jgi:predicted acyltransferase
VLSVQKTSMSSALPAGMRASTQSEGRLRSLDVFRGATIAAMVLVNAQFSHEVGYRQFWHSDWEGWTFADTISPCFLFIVGMSLTLSSRSLRGEDHARTLKHAIWRTLLILACGIAIENLQFPVHEFPFIAFTDHLQLSGTLQKIALCYLLAFLIYWRFGWRGAVVAIISINLLYLAFLYLYPVPGCGPGSLAKSCNFPGYLDDVLLGPFRSLGPRFDGDGLASVIPATTTVLFGTLAGARWQTNLPRRKRLVYLLAAGIVLICLGELSSAQIPINKYLWTTSFSLLMAGLSATGLAIVIWLVEGRQLISWLRPIEILGLNAITAYVVARFLENVPRIHVMGMSLYTDVLERMASPANASLLFAALVLMATYFIVWSMNRQGWKVKLP